jgi:hypothetical protein
MYDLTFREEHSAQLVVLSTMAVEVLNRGSFVGRLSGKVEPQTERKENSGCRNEPTTNSAISSLRLRTRFTNQLIPLDSVR